MWVPARFWHSVAQWRIVSSSPISCLWYMMCFTSHSWRNVYRCLMKLWKLKGFPSSLIWLILSTLSKSWMKRKEWQGTMWWSSTRCSGKTAQRMKPRGNKRATYWSITPTFSLILIGSCVHWNVFPISFPTLGTQNLGSTFCFRG